MNYRVPELCGSLLEELENSFRSGLDFVWCAAELDYSSSPLEVDDPSHLQEQLGPRRWVVEIPRYGLCR